MIVRIYWKLSQQIGWRSGIKQLQMIHCISNSWAQ